MIKAFISLLFVLTVMGSFAQNKIIIQANLGKEKINKNIYGHFAGHLGNCIYNGFYVGNTSKVIPDTY